MNFDRRNLYTTSDYQRYGTLVVELNKYSLFQDVPPDIRGNTAVVFGRSDGDFLDFAHIADGEEADKQELLRQFWRNMTAEAMGD